MSFHLFCWFSASSWSACHIIRFVRMCCIRPYVLFVFTLLFGVLWAKILTNFAMDTPTYTVLHGASVMCRPTSRRVHRIVYSRDLLLSLRSTSLRRRQLHSVLQQLIVSVSRVLTVAVAVAVAQVVAITVPTRSCDLSVTARRSSPATVLLVRSIALNVTYDSPRRSS